MGTGLFILRLVWVLHSDWLSAFDPSQFFLLSRGGCRLCWFAGVGSGVLAGVSIGKACSTRTSRFSLGGGVPLGVIPEMAIAPGDAGSC